jgi:2-iminobutanoate/2-iminopropanoate deaminase
MTNDAEDRSLKVHILDGLYRHSSNVAHGVEVPPGARLLFTNGQVGTRPDGTTPGTTAEQAEVVFARLEAVLAAARMVFSDIARLTVFLTDPADVGTFVKARDQVMGGHKPGAIILVVKGLARPELKIEIEVIAAKVD